jgi:ribosomal subunit interface protein
MKIPLQITFRGISPSEAIEARIHKKVAKLDKIYDRVMSCRVAVETPHRRHHQGKLYHVRVDLTVPGGELVVNREAHEKQAHGDVYVAIRDAFNAAQRQLLEYVARHKGQIKPRQGPPHGVVAKLFHAEGYGFLETGDGREIFFHRHSVINDGFDRLEIGAEVRFAEEQGDKGAQASTVSPIGKEGKHLA